jgi:hypothetical protein
VAYASYNFIKMDKKTSWLSSYKFTDSLKNTFYQQTFSDSCRIETEANFVGNLGVLKTYTKGQLSMDTVYTRDQAEASFPGGNMGWAKYVQKACLILILQIMVPAMVNTWQSSALLLMRMVTSPMFNPKQILDIISKQNPWISLPRALNGYLLQGLGNELKPTGGSH